MHRVKLFKWPDSAYYDAFLGNQIAEEKQFFSLGINVLNSLCKEEGRAQGAAFL